MARQAAAGHERRSTFDSVSPALIGSVVRRARTERNLLMTLFALVLVTAFVFAAIPRLFNQMSDDGLAHAVRSTSTFQRNIHMSREMRIAPGAGSDTYLPVDQEGEAFQESLAATIQSIIDRREYTVDTVRYRVVNVSSAAAFPFPRYVTLRHQSQVAPHLTMVAGRQAEATDATIVVPRTVLGMPQDTVVPVYEMMLSTETARQLGLLVGDQLVLEPYADDQLVRLVPRREQNFIALTLVGLFDVRDVNDEFWFGDPQINRAVEYDDGNLVHLFATALMAPDAYRQLFDTTGFSFRYGWRYFVDPDALDAGALGQLAADMRRLDAEYGSSFGRQGQPAVRTGLSAVFQRFESQRNLTEAILALTTIGLLAVALAVIGLVAALIAAQRREATVLIRGRGGSSRQLLAAQAAEGLLVSLPAAFLGYLLALLLVSGRMTIWPIVAAISIAIAATILLVGLMAPFARRALGSLERPDLPLRRASGRRLVFEMAVVTLALLAVYLLQRRGLSGSSAVARLNEFDPYLAAMPVLLGLAVGIVVMRLYPLPMRIFAWLAALRRDLVPVLGFRRVVRQPGAMSLPLLVLLLSMAIAVFSAVVLHTISEGQVVTSWQRVGADYRVNPTGSGYLYRGIDLSTVPGVETIAPAYLSNDIPFTERAAGYMAVQLFGPDVDLLTQANAGNRAAPNFPEDLFRAPLAGLGTPGNPIPALVSTEFQGLAQRVGDTFALTVMGRATYFVVVERRDRFPGLHVGRPFVVASLRHLEASNPDRQFRPTVLFVRAPDQARDALATTLAAQTQSAVLQSRSREYALVHESPLIAGVQGGYRIGLVVTGLYAALAVVVALTLTARERARDLAYLRTLGLSREQAVGLTAAELSPPVTLALIAGVGLGIAAARLVEPGVDLTAFTGPDVPAPLTIDWLTVTAVILALLGAIALAVILTTIVARRTSLGQVLRVGEA
jgi:putative ABC transport system permease protein